MMQQRISLNQRMLEHAALQQCSGETIASYARQIGVPHYKMHYWVHKYKAKQKKQNIEGHSIEFIDLGSFGIKAQPVNSVSPTVSFKAAPESSMQDERLPQMTLTFPNGMCLKIY